MGSIGEIKEVEVHNKVLLSASEDMLRICSETEQLERGHFFPDVMKEPINHFLVGTNNVMTGGKDNMILNIQHID